MGVCARGRMLGYCLAKACQLCSMFCHSSVKKYKCMKKLTFITLYWAATIFACMLYSHHRSAYGYLLGFNSVIFRELLERPARRVTLLKSLRLSSSFLPYLMISLIWGAFVGVPREAVPYQHPFLASVLIMCLFILVISWCAWRDLMMIMHRTETSPEA